MNILQKKIEELKSIEVLLDGFNIDKNIKLLERYVREFNEYNHVKHNVSRIEHYIDIKDTYSVLVIPSRSIFYRLDKIDFDNLMKLKQL